MLYGPPGTGKTLTARAVANRTDACFIRVIGVIVNLFKSMWVKVPEWSDKFSKWLELKKLVLFSSDEIDAIGGARSDGGSGR